MKVASGSEYLRRRLAPRASRLGKYTSLTTLTSVGGWDNGSRDFLTSLCKKY